MHSYVEDKSELETSQDTSCTHPIPYNQTKKKKKTQRAINLTIEQMKGFSFF